VLRLMPEVLQTAATILLRSYLPNVAQYLFCDIDLASKFVKSDKILGEWAYNSFILLLYGLIWDLSKNIKICTTNYVGMADCTESRHPGFADAANISILPYAYRMGLSLLLALLPVLAIPVVTLVRGNEKGHWASVRWPGQLGRPALCQPTPVSVCACYAAWRCSLSAA